MRGELTCAILSEFPERFRHTSTVLLGDPPIERKLESHRVDRGRVILKLAGIDGREAASAFRGAIVEVPLDQAVPLPPGRYYWHQVVGLRVLAQDGRELGKVTEILETGANDVYVVHDGRRELLIPAIKDVVRQIDPDNGVMLVELLPGMEG